MNQPALIMWGSLTAAVLLLAPGAWKVAAIAPAFLAYNIGIKGRGVAI